MRQFVAMPLGDGYTVEEQLTGAAVHGGVQLVAYPMKAERYEALRLKWDSFMLRRDAECSEGPVLEGAMGLAPGGRMKQEIYDDPYGLDAWDQRHGSRCFVSLLNSLQWLAVTGERPPSEPPTAQDYAACGLPWFDYYGGDAQAVPGSDKLRRMKSVAQQAKSTGQGPLPGNETITAPPVVTLGKRRPVRECAGEASLDP